MDISSLFEASINVHASDLHLIVGMRPFVRVDGQLTPLGDWEILDEETVKEMIFPILSSHQKDLLLTNKELDFSFAYENKVSFRINAYFQRGTLAAAFRLIPTKIRSIEELNLPGICHQFAQLQSGFVLVTGPTGHGKSSTLAAIIEEINQTQARHIVTIEDPIEYIYLPKRSIISQREMHNDTHSWAVSLRSVLREDPNVVLIGEMRDYETIAAALTIAETGHLVFATLHTNSASQTLDRIVDVFPPHQQTQVRMQLSGSLEAVFSQRLLLAVGGGRIPVAEVLIATPAVRTNIREGKTHLIDNIIQTSAEVGMMTLEANMDSWIKKGRLSLEVAQGWSLRPEHLMRLVRGR